MWIGTESGLNRYDGNEFKIYQPSVVKINNLSNAFITSVAQDNDENIWVTTRKGLNRIDAAADTTEIILPSPFENIKDLPGDLLWDILPDTDTSMWIAVDSKPLVQYNPVSKLFHYFDFKQYLKENNIEFTPVYHSILKILKKSPTELWLATTEGIFSFNKGTGNFKLEYGVALDNINYFYYDSGSQKLYCSDEREKLYIYDGKTGEMKILSKDAFAGINKSLRPYSLPGQAIFVPGNGGLALINSENEVLGCLNQANDDREEFLMEKIKTLYKDREGITWIGTLKGMSRFVPKLNANLHVTFSHNLQFDVNFALKNFLYCPVQNEWLVASFKDNKIWIVNNSTGNVSELIRPAVYRNDTCYAFFSSNPDTVFLLCEATLQIYFRKQNKWEKISFPAPLNKGTLTCMTIDNKGNYWVGTRRNGILVYNPVNKAIWTPDKNLFEPHIINALQFDGKNNCVWVGTHTAGLFNVDINSKTFTRMRRDDSSPNSFHSSLINDITQDKKNNLWVTMLEGGIAKYLISEPPGKGVTNYELQNGLPDNNVYGVTAGEDDDIWFTTSKGIGLITADGQLKSFFNKENGLPYSKFQQSIACLPGRKIASTVENSLFCFDINMVTRPHQSTLIINQVLLRDSVQIKNINHKFQFNQNTIRLDFVMIDFVSPAAIEYFYMLDGVDKDWVSNGKQRSVRYSGLHPGKYIFKVKARNANGEFSNQMAEWKFEIKPPFWKTWWFLLISTLLIGYLTFYFARDRINKIKQREKFKSEYERKIAEMEMQALRAQMNPHFMFNSLNSINNFILKNDPDNASGYLTKFSRLMRLILDNSRNEWVLLENELKALELYVELEAVRFDNAFTYTIEVTQDISVETVMVPPLLIQPYAENAIWHGLLHRKEPGGKLDVRLWKNDGKLYIEIEDNGVGRDEAKRLKSKTATKQKSHGMKITAERMDIVNKVYNVDAGVVVTDLEDDRGNQNGTMVLITLKYQTHDSHNSG